MAEIVGVAASATQLAVMCVSLLDLMKKIKGGSSTLKRYHQQLNELRSVSESISTNPLLQTPEVESHTQTLLAIIDDNSLSHLLRQGRLLRTLGLLHKERDLLDAFSSLERHKTNLSLLIEDIQSRALYQIQGDIKVIANMSSNLPVASSNQDMDTTAREKDNSSFLPSTTSALVPHAQSFNQQTSGQIEVSEVLLRTLLSSLSNNQTAQQFVHGAQIGSSHRQYTGCKATAGADQINGIAFNGSFKHPKAETVSIPGVSSYNDCQKYGSGTQVNGIEIEIAEDGEPVVVPDYSASWINCGVSAESPDAASIKGRVCQVNGVNYRPAKNEDNRQSK
ncbi:hypothetical protein BGZ61DRAFT_535896 [Ilyonectria robusta]|uniref:uncharacterized protein n=1 Tax=Ilyonectria robusta TaxID=1079257 RepID=UPI001E8D1DB2|nr:uncharacterized protein BGZ61DRAFT_535896 [Ilyonectria robusta]KAH8676913.1 hypothetical protein BGZ61DRAFT_535896 [Ilyonectria robusta]